MGLFVVKPTVFGIEFEPFSKDLFKKYSSINKHEYFTSCFECVNKINLGNKYQILFLNDFAYIYHKVKDKLIALDVHGILNFKEDYELDEVKFVSASEIDLLKSRYKKIKLGAEYIDPIYSISDLVCMEGKEYSNVRKNRNYFTNHYPNAKFVKYKDDYKNHVLKLYSIWMEQSVNSGNDFIVDKTIFKDCLINDYHKKYVVINDKKIVGFTSYLEMNHERMVALFNMKMDKEYRGLNTYMVHELCKVMLVEGYSEFNLGAMDAPGDKNDYKEFLKPCRYEKYYFNVTVG